MIATNAGAQQMKGRQKGYQKALQEKLDSQLQEMMDSSEEKVRKQDRWTCEVRLNDSADYKGKVDTEISLTMPFKEFKEYAPIAVLEAVAVPHNFPTGKIYVRETQSRKVASIDYRAADPIGNKYRTGKPKAVEKAIAQMSDEIKWH
jgi:hypothetical protein